AARPILEQESDVRLEIGIEVARGGSGDTGRERGPRDPVGSLRAVSRDEAVASVHDDEVAARDGGDVEERVLIPPAQEDRRWSGGNIDGVRRGGGSALVGLIEEELGSGRAGDADDEVGAAIGTIDLPRRHGGECAWEQDLPRG